MTAWWASLNERQVRHVWWLAIAVVVLMVPAAILDGAGRHYGWFVFDLAHLIVWGGAFSLADQRLRSSEFHEITVRARIDVDGIVRPLRIDDDTLTYWPLPDGVGEQTERWGDLMMQDRQVVRWDEHTERWVGEYPM